MQLPKIKENLLVQDLNGEVLVYDQTTNKSYPSAAPAGLDLCVANNPT